MLIHSSDTLATGTLTNTPQYPSWAPMLHSLNSYPQSFSKSAPGPGRLIPNPSSLKPRLCRGQPSPQEARDLVQSTDTLSPHLVSTPALFSCLVTSVRALTPNFDLQGYSFVFTAASVPSTQQSRSVREEWPCFTFPQARKACSMGYAYPRIS